MTTVDSSSEKIVTIQSKLCVKAVHPPFEPDCIPLREAQVQEPDSKKPVAANVVRVINRALHCVKDEDVVGSESSADAAVSDSQDETDARPVFRRDLLKDDLAIFYNDLARLRVEIDNQSPSSSGGSESDEEEQDDHYILSVGDISTDILSAFKSRYGGHVD